MARKKRKWKSLKSIGIIGNYLPRRCGIATFTTDLTEALVAAAPEISSWAMVMNDKPEGYKYPPRVRFEIGQNQPTEYRLAADFFNMNQVDIVCLQHEYGIFGGRCGRYILDLLHDLRMPVVTTLHTVLEKPGKDQREVMDGLAELSDRLVVMSERAAKYLRDIYDVAEDKVVMIPHGIPDVPFLDTAKYKEQFGVAGRKVILSFGLLSPGKGVEHMLDSLPAVVEKHPDVVYVIVGATHPNIRKTSGEGYRTSLQLRAEELGVEEHVIFHNRFVELEELCEFLGSADVYVTTYVNEVQITSGTLAYAMGTGRAVVSTPYWYAQEMLADDRGVLVPFDNRRALSTAIIGLFDDDQQRQAIRERAYEFTRRMAWPRVALEYLDLFTQAKAKRLRLPTLVTSAKTVGVLGPELPDVRLDHLRRLTDDTGILQHARFTVARRDDGYCTDDNARALIVASMAQRILPDDPSLDLLAGRYLSFLVHAFDESTGRFRNFMTYDRQWHEELGSEDSHGRAIWGLGVAMALGGSGGNVALLVRLFQDALPAVEKFTSPRSWAFALVGIHAYLRRFGGDSGVRRVRGGLAERLFNQFTQNGKDDSWPWLEDSLNYCNAKIPHALILSGQWMQRNDMLEMGLKSLQWLCELQTGPRGQFSPVGSNGWYSRGGEKAVFDQQPIEAHSMIEACLEAFNVTRDGEWMSVSRACVDWFLGRNDQRESLYDYATGGCRDGLNPEGVNENQGAESTVACLMSLLPMRARLSGGPAKDGVLADMSAEDTAESTTP